MVEASTRRKWSSEVTETSDALDLEADVRRCLAAQ